MKELDTAVIKVKIFDVSHFDPIGLATDLFKVVVRFTQGFIDSLRFDQVFKLLQAEPRLRSIVISCFLLNIAYLLVMVVIDNFFLPYLTAWQLEAANGDSVAYVVAQLSATVVWLIYEVTWVVLMFAASFFRSNKWYAELAELVPAPTPPRTLDKSSQSGSTLVSQISDGVSFALQLVLLKVANSAVDQIPYTGWYLSATLQCLLASFYAFESHWSRSHPGQRPAAFIAFIERDWAYFLGFGVLLTAVTIKLPVFMSLALYAAILPLFIIIASRPDAAAWQKSSAKPIYLVLPHSIKYFDMGSKGVDLILVFIKHQISIRYKKQD